MRQGEYLTFFKQLTKSYNEIGAMMPSSRSLGRQMVKPLVECTHPVRILEVGPGTGPFTREILLNMRSDDHLSVCEINPVFLESLKKKLESFPAFHLHRDRVRFFQGPIQDLGKQVKQSGVKFDLIVSSLPFSNFTPELVDEILGLFRELTADGGSVVFMEYLGLRRLSAFFATRERRERMLRVEEVVNKWKNVAASSGRLSTDKALLNVPPAKSIRMDFSV
jgi:phospholipid N-methyltransferase